MMQRTRRAVLSVTLVIMLSACVSTVASVVTAPVRAVGQVADWTTTSQDEADRNRGRALRERDEALGRLERRRVRAVARCDDGDRDACAAAQSYAEEIAAIRDGDAPR